MESCCHKKSGGKFSNVPLVAASFQLAEFQQDGILLPQELWRRVFNLPSCGGEFSTCLLWRRVFNLPNSNKMKSCCHKKSGGEFSTCLLWRRVFNLPNSNKMESCCHEDAARFQLASCGGKFLTCLFHTMKSCDHEPVATLSRCRGPCREYGAHVMGERLHHRRRRILKPSERQVAAMACQGVGDGLWDCPQTVQ